MSRWLATVALLVATGLYVHLHPPVNLALGRGVLAACPTSFGDWNGTDLSFADAVVEELKADDLLIRRYRRGPAVVWLCMVYHQNRRFGAHDPQLCYQSQGYLVDPGARVRVEDGRPGGLEVNRFVVERQGERRVVYYWWTTAGLSTTDADAFRGRMALRGALDNRSWGAFVRVEAQVRGHDDDTADREASEFAARVTQALPGVFAAAEGSGGVRR
jgi:EpsI family protein